MQNANIKQFEGTCDGGADSLDAGFVAGAWFVKNDGSADQTFTIGGQAITVKAGEGIPVVVKARTATINGASGGYRITAYENADACPDERQHDTTTGQIADSAVTEAKLATGAATADKIGALAVTEAKLGNGAVTTDKLGALAVTEAKLGASSVTEAKLGTGAVTADKVGVGAVTHSKKKIVGLVALADADAVLTAAQLVDSGIFTQTPTAARGLTTDTAAAIAAAIPGQQNGTWFDVVIVNKTAGAFDITLLAGANVSIEGSPVISSLGAKSGTFRFCVTPAGVSAVRIA